jgi:hypothetical protein
MIVSALVFLKLTCPSMRMTVNGILQRVLTTNCSGNEHLAFQTYNGHIVTAMVLGGISLVFLIFFYRTMKGIRAKTAQRRDINPVN